MYSLYRPEGWVVYGSEKSGLEVDDGTSKPTLPLASQYWTPKTPEEAQIPTEPNLQARSLISFYKWNL